MISRRGIIVPLAALIFGTIIVTLAASFASMLLFPPPTAPAVTLREVAAALEGKPVEGLRRSVSLTEPLLASRSQPGGEQPVKLALAAGLQVPPSAIRAHAPKMSLMVSGGAASGVRGDARAVGVALSSDYMRSVVGTALLQADTRFPPFEAAYQQRDGAWVKVTPDASPMWAWYWRILGAFCMAAALLLPLGYHMAHRIINPLRRLADAAESIKSDRGLDRLSVEGPAEVRTLAETLNRLLDRIEAQMKAHGMSLAAIAHDLRTPLTALRVRAEDSGDDVRQGIINDADRMEAMISQVLGYIHGEQPVVTNPVNFSQHVLSVVEAFQSSDERIKFDYNEELWVRGDQTGLERVTANLISNALRYGGSAEVNLARIGQQAVLTVADRGPGLEPEELSRVGQPFYRPDSSRNTESGGTGLGLAIVRQAALSHGAKFRLENRPCGGLIASFSIPMMQE